MITTRAPDGANNVSLQVKYGTQMLTVAVMAILITAPLGAILIMLTGPRLLARDVPEEGEEVHEHEMQTMPETELDQSPLSLARFKAAQHHGSQQLIKARRYSCL